MSGSEISQIRETIAEEYKAAKWGLTGEAFGRAKHAFISARMKRIEEEYKALEASVGDQALAVVIETLETVPEVPTRAFILTTLRQAFGHEADCEYLIHDIEKFWKTSDLLEAIFEAENAAKITHATP